MPFPKGTEVIVRIRHSGADFAATGDVTNNITSEGMGVEFIQIAPKDRAIMESWLGLTTGRDKASSYEPLQGIPITVSGQSYRGDFSEDAETEIVIDEGALLHLSAPVSAGQVVRLKNRLTRMEQNCRVLFVDPIKQGKLSLVAVGFLEHRQQSIRGIPITVSGQSSTGEFSEETETQIVMHNGALLHLSAPVSAGQVVQVKNRLTRMERNRRVLFVDSKSGQDKSSLLAVEFLEPVQNFWGIKQKS